MAINFKKEYARNGKDNGDILNPGETHLACVVLVDTSGSMASVSNQITEGLTAMKEALEEDSYASGRVDICIITFDDRARIVVPFASIGDLFIPEIDCDGRTAMHEAVDFAINELKARIKQYQENQVPQYRHWIYMITDGGANDADNGSFQKLIDYQNRKVCTFFPVALGDEVDTELLGSLNITHKVLQANKEDFKSTFEWLSASLSRVSSSRSGDTVTLPDPKEFDDQINVLTCGA